MTILKNFVKYHSLGNDFIIFDWYKKPSLYMQNELHDASWKDFVKNVCSRHYGVGADGVLIITSCPQVGMPEMLIFNANGTQAENCLNGLRCVAQYLFINYHFPAHFTIKLGQRVIDCVIDTSEKERDISIITHAGAIEYVGQKSITVDKKQLNGHVVNIGNPHFIVFEPVDLAWLAQHGSAIESHETFPFGTNVEFVWKQPNHTSAYHMAVFERGCGMTLACSSGAAAVTGLLVKQNMENKNQKITLAMSGGSLTTWVDDTDNVILQTSAHLIFRGSFDDVVYNLNRQDYTAPHCEK